MLDEKKNNYIMSVVKKGLYFGVAICDVSTGDFYATQIVEDNNFFKLLDEIARYMPAELIINPMMKNSEVELNQIKDRLNPCITEVSESDFSEETSLIKNLYNIEDNQGREFKVYDTHILCIAAINGLNKYLNDTQKIKLEHINTIKIYETTKYMALDINARRNLELIERMRDKSKKGTLLWVLDKTSTSMGGRLLRRWINDPLVDIDEINNRLNAVKEFKENIILRGDVLESLKKVYDIERLVRKDIIWKC